MQLKDIRKKLPDKAYEILSKDITELRPCQAKAIEKGLLDGKNLLVCTPTASGKTLVAELAAIKAISEHHGKVVYIVPLRALASEKYKEFTGRYKSIYKIALSIGDLDSSDSHLIDYDLIITTSEKLDSLTRHHTPWLRYVRLVIIDEIHLMNDPGRGPTLEILLTILRDILPKAQFIGLSATIGNPEELADWLQAKTVIDKWRPVRLYEGVYLNGEIEYKK